MLVCKIMASLLVISAGIAVVLSEDRVAQENNQSLTAQINDTLQGAPPDEGAPWRFKCCHGDIFHSNYCDEPCYPGDM